MQRRGFLTGLVGALAAPAIVRADSLMKIFVPKPEILLPYGLIPPPGTLDEFYARILQPILQQYAMQLADQQFYSDIQWGNQSDPR
ncbi:hypothetical protein M0Q28_05990 [Patescibacteria group bacterium]|nr:hypothetical protein [Patescibacteria group bacterium]